MTHRLGSSVALVGLVLLVAGCAPAAAPSTEPGDQVLSVSSADVQRAIDGLASVGVETRVRPSDATSMAPVDTARSPVRLIRVQVRNMVLEQASGGGTRGSDLDAVTAAAGGGPVSALVAGWVEAQPTPAATWAASLLGPDRPPDPATAAFPTLALMAFVADATPVPASASGLGPPAISARPASRLDLGDETLALLAVASSSDLCAEVSAYLSAAIEDIVDADAQPPVWLRQLIDLYAPQYANDPALLRRTIGAIALLTYATSLARPWTVNLAPDPTAVTYGIEGGDPVEGDVVLTVSSGANLFADDVAECASLAEAELASLPIEGSSVVWDSAGLGGHAVEVTSTTMLDSDGSASLTYETATEAKEAADNGDPVTAQTTVRAWVDRAEMAQLASVVRSILLGEAAGTPAGETAKELYEAMEPALGAAMRPTGVASIDVTYHTTKASPSPNTSQQPVDVSGTWLGTWQNDPELGEATGGLTFTLSQTGDRVTGTAQFSGPTCVGEVPIEGTARGSSVDLPMPSQWDIRFVGTVEGDSMAGTYSAIACWPTGVIVTGSWQASRE